MWTELSAWAKPAIAGLLLLCALGGLSGWAARRFGKRELTGTPQDRSERLKDRVLFAAAVVAATIVYGALVIGSFENLTAWAGDTLGWNNWQQYLVPVSLDGLGTAAGVLAFRAVKKRLSPYTCYAMVWGATATSVTINATEGGKHGGPAAIYMGFLSVAVMAMFHLFLGQFQAGAEHQGRKYPRFGARWLTKAWGKDATILLFIDWVNSPDPTLEPTVANAILHRGRVLAARVATAKLLARKTREEIAAEQVHTAELARQVRDAENADTLAELQAAVDDALAKVAEECAARLTEAAAAEAQSARLMASVADREATIAKLSAALARADRGSGRGSGSGSGSRGGQRSNRSGGQPSEQKREQVAPPDGEQASGETTEQTEGVTALHSDEQIIAALRKDWANEIAETGKALARNQIEKRGGCSARQAKRVILALTAEMPPAVSSVPNDQEAAQ